MYILRLQYNDGRVEYREYPSLYMVDTIMCDISLDFKIYADLESAKVFKFLDEDGIKLERDLCIQAEMTQFEGDNHGY